MLQRARAASTMLETVPASESLMRAGGEVTDRWIDVIQSVFERDGLSREARRSGRQLVASIEGALILARIEQSAAPIREISQQP